MLRLTVRHDPFKCSACSVFCIHDQYSGNRNTALELLIGFDGILNFSKAQPIHAEPAHDLFIVKPASLGQALRNLVNSGFSLNSFPDRRREGRRGQVLSIRP